MAAKSKAVKKPVTTKPAKVGKNVPVKKPAPKKPIATKRTTVAPATVVKSARPRAVKIVQPEWRITLVFGTATGVYGLATDQRVYRWNTRSAVWILHKEGIHSTAN